MKRQKQSGNRPLLVVTAAFCCLMISFVIIGCVAKQRPKEATTEATTFAVTERSVSAFASAPSVAQLRTYYSNPPLRVNTEGASIYHRPFCPYAKKALLTYGFERRNDYWRPNEIPSSKTPDAFCMAGIFEFEDDCSQFNNPDTYPNAEPDAKCSVSAFVSLSHPDTLDLQDKYLCHLDGYIGVFVDSDDKCLPGGKYRANDTLTMAGFNAIKHKKGDVNRDGDCDDEDYPFFNACFGLSSKNCLRNFDFDDDGDVDATDFTTFEDNMFSGNSYWACSYTNRATNVVINPRPLIPLRVGTEGSQYYHNLDCPIVQNSWVNHGIEKRVDFYTWAQITASGRIPATAGSYGVICDASSNGPPATSNEVCDGRDTCDKLRQQFSEANCDTNGTE